MAKGYHSNVDICHDLILLAVDVDKNTVTFLGSMCYVVDWAYINLAFIIMKHHHPGLLSVEVKHVVSEKNLIIFWYAIVPIRNAFLVEKIFLFIDEIVLEIV